MNKILKTSWFLIFLVFMSFVFDANTSICLNKKYLHKLRAICRKDNGFVTNNDKAGELENVPEKAAIIINQIVDSIKKNSSNLGYSILGGVYKIKMTPLISIYIAKIYEGDGPFYYIVAYDAGTGMATNNPPSLYGNYMENNEGDFQPEARLLTSPLISFEDINSDGKDEIKIKERVHDGTTYNAEIDHYYDIGDRMNLFQILSVESISINASDRNCKTYRILSKSTLFDTIKCENDKPQSIGRVFLQINTHSKIISKQVEDNLYGSYLISNLGEDSLLIR